MDHYRRRREEDERRTLSRHALLCSASAGRDHAEPPDPLRTCFQVDRERIVHSKSFRRLKHKTQVFFSPQGDHSRPRLTHTLEVTAIARTIASCLAVNEDLTEAIALGHDLGHTPFGHAGEKVLAQLCPGGFKHVQQSVRVVELLENDGAGLNLTREVRYGILHHSKGKGAILPPPSEADPGFLEAQIVRISDVTAYLNHDLDDALRAGVLAESDLPAAILEGLGSTNEHRRDRVIASILSETTRHDDGVLRIEGRVLELLVDLRTFMFERVYEAERVHDAYTRAEKIIRDLYDYFLQRPVVLADYYDLTPTLPHAERVRDFIAGMTDTYILQLYEKVFMPQRWSLLW